MFRFLEIWIGHTKISLPVDFLIQILISVLFFLFLNKFVRNSSLWKNAVLVLVPAYLAGYAADEVHLLMAGNQSGIGGEGQSYFGALGLQAFLFWILSKMLLRKTDSDFEIMDLFAIASPFIYALLRFGCLANGCCYGKLCSYPWAIRFKDERCLTPLLGLPLHPTQIYSMLHGLILGLIIVILYRHRGVLCLKNKLFWVFLGGMGLGRLGIDPFRAGMKAEVWHGWTFNQWISLLLVVFSLKKTLFFRRASMASASLLFFLSLGLSGCLTPEPPTAKTITHTKAIAPSVLVHQMASDVKRSHLPPKNLLFVAVDDFPEDVQAYRSFLSKAYMARSQTPRIEDVLWWHYAPQFAHLYQEVVQIQYDGLGWGNLSKAIDFLEAEQIPFDMVLLAHGIPNHLVSSKKQAPISWKDLKRYTESRELKNLNLVFLQSCFGDTLAQDFVDMGAGSVISFHDLHNNFLFFDVFMKAYVRRNADVDVAFSVASQSFKAQVSSELSYEFIVKKVLNLPLDQFLREVTMPSLRVNLGLKNF